ncbi:MAG: hypothetical protein KAJ19_25935, partial [Gammaproteobacteria bacterium]|nr:hypothetical protein [Gammaproteobacteria bacterium]
MANVFTAQGEDATNPPDLTPIDTGATTARPNTLPAETVAKLGNLTEAVGKGFLAAKVESDVEDAVSGKKDFLTDTPNGGIAAQRDKILRDFGTSMDSLAQGGSPELAALNASAAIKKISAIAPGWEQEIKKAALDKLGYDPGGLLIKSALQRQQSEAENEQQMMQRMAADGFDGRIPAHRQAFGLLKRTEAELRLLKMQTEIRAAGAKGNKEAMTQGFNVSSAEYNVATANGLSSVLVKYSDSVPYATYNDDGVITNMDAINDWWGSGQREVMLNDVLQFENAYVAQMNSMGAQYGVKPATINAAQSSVLARLKEFKNGLNNKEDFKSMINLGSVRDDNERRELMMSSPAAKALWIISGG